MPTLARLRFGWLLRIFLPCDELAALNDARVVSGIGLLWGTFFTSPSPLLVRAFRETIILGENKYFFFGAYGLSNPVVQPATRHGVLGREA